MPRRAREDADDDDDGMEGHWRRHRMCCGGHGRLWLGVFILLIGLSWLGHDLGWWAFTLPWFPLALTLVGLAMVFHWMKRQA